MDWNLIVDVVWKLGTLLGFGWMYLANRNKVTNARITELENDIDEKMEAHATRLTMVESEIKHALTTEDMGHLYERITTVERRLEDRISRVDKSVNTMAGEIKGLNDNVRMMLGRIAEKGMP